MSLLFLADAFCVSDDGLMLSNNTAESQREEEFQDVPLIVTGFDRITDSLAAFSAYETLSGDNQ